MDALTASAIGSALATLVLAVVAFLALRTSNQAIQQTRKEIDLTREDLELTKSALRLAERQADEARLTREADWQPLLVVTGDVRASPPASHTVFVRNVGRGAALNVFAAVSIDGVALQLGFEDKFIAVDGSIAELFAREYGQGAHLLDGVIDTQNQWAIFCEDQFGKRYRFLQGQAVHEEWPVDAPPRPPWTYRADS